MEDEGLNTSLTHSFIHRCVCVCVCVCIYSRYPRPFQNDNMTSSIKLAQMRYRVLKFL